MALTLASAVILTGCAGYVDTGYVGEPYYNYPYDYYDYGYGPDYGYGLYGPDIYVFGGPGHHEHFEHEFRERGFESRRAMGGGFHGAAHAGGFRGMSHGGGHGSGGGHGGGGHR